MLCGALEACRNRKERRSTMLWQMNERIGAELSEGIVIDYISDRFAVVIKDDVWTDYERKALHHNPLHIYFGYERICAFFLIENVDSIDTSDAVFDIHACDEKEAVLKKEQYELEIYLADSQNKVCAARAFTLSKADSKIIREALVKQQETAYDEEGFDRALYKLQHTYEPFEMEQLALLKASF